MMNFTTPEKALFVTLIIVAYNEEDYLEDLLNDYLHQDYPPHLRELIFVDSNSEDATHLIALKFAQAHPELAITILDNPQRTLAPGINLALRVARGDIVCRVDGHVSIPSDYLSRGVSLLIEKEKSGVVCVGGPWITEGNGFWGRAMATVLSTPFGVGNAKYRYTKTAGYVDSVPCGIYWKRVFDEVGLYREDLVRTEDNEMHARIKARRWKFYLSPDLMTRYYCRSTISDFLRQAFGNGYWSMISWRQSSWRHLAPFGFLIALIALGFGSLLWAPFRFIFLMVVSIYALSAFAVAFRIAFRAREWLWVPALPLLFFLLHMTYGLGSLSALIVLLFLCKNGLRRRDGSPSS